MKFNNLKPYQNFQLKGFHFCLAPPSPSHPPTPPPPPTPPHLPPLCVFKCLINSISSSFTSEFSFVCWTYLLSLKKIDGVHFGPHVLTVPYILMVPHVLLCSIL